MSKIILESIPLPDKPKVCIVLPTYNEAKNIKQVLGRISENHLKKPKKNTYSLEVLVVDDNSPDGTANIVREYEKENNRRPVKVFLFSRKSKEGLGAAYIAGMRFAMNHLQPDIIMEMDADLSHDPKYIPSLIQEIKRGADFVIGSRYVSGGSIPDQWGWHRKVLSNSANYLTKILLGHWKIKDCTGGFRAIRTSVLEVIDLSSLNVKGYAFQSILLDQAMRNGAKISEVPISFVDRSEGSSKMKPKDLAEGGLVLLVQRLKNTFNQNQRALPSSCPWPNPLRQ